MTSKIVSSLGIMLATIGTVMTMWTILHTEEKVVGTFGEPIARREAFPMEKRRAVIGTVLIIVGGVLQIIGQFI